MAYAIAACYGAGAAQAQALINPGIGSGILPQTGFGGGLDNLRDFVNSPLTEGASRMFTFEPSINAQAGYTDNVNSGYNSRNGRKPVGGFEVRLQPDLNFKEDSRRVQVNFTYNPTAFYYPTVNSQSRIDQSLNADALVEVVPRTLFVDMKAFANTSTYGALNNGQNSPGLNRQNRTQAYSYLANPYFVHEFGGVGTAKISYTVNDTFYNYYTPQNTGTTPKYNNNAITQTEAAMFTTGEDFGRLNHTLSLTATQYNSTGTLLNGHRNLAAYDLSYAANRYVTLTGRVGYEDLYYDAAYEGGSLASPAYGVKEPIGGGGVTVTPNDNSTLAVGYGHMDGANNLSVNGNYKPTERTAIYVSNSSGLTTDAQDLQNLLTTSSTGPGGVSIDPSTGAPVQYSSSGYGTNGRLYRLTRTSLTGLLALDRDTFSISFERDQQQNPGGVVIRSIASTSTYGSLSWMHDKSETLRTHLNVQYGVDVLPATSFSPKSTNPTFSVAAGLTKDFSDKLSGTLNYTYYQRDSNYVVDRMSVNEILLGLLQRF